MIGLKTVRGQSSWYRTKTPRCIAPSRHLSYHHAAHYPGSDKSPRGGGLSVARKPPCSMHPLWSDSTLDLDLRRRRSLHRCLGIESMVWRFGRRWQRVLLSPADAELDMISFDHDGRTRCFPRAHHGQARAEKRFSRAVIQARSILLTSLPLAVHRSHKATYHPIRPFEVYPMCRFLPTWPYSPTTPRAVHLSSADCSSCHLITG